MRFAHLFFPTGSNFSGQRHKKHPQLVNVGNFTHCLQVLQSSAIANDFVFERGAPKLSSENAADPRFRYRADPH
jgi:hypothetical protein